MNFHLSSGCVAGCLLAAVNVAMYAQTNLGKIEIGHERTETVTVVIPTARTVSSISVVTAGAPNLDFKRDEGGSCAIGVSYQNGATCTVRVVFGPRYPGDRHGAVVLRDQFEDIVGITYLQGEGHGPRAAFLPGSQTRVSKGFLAPEGLAADGGGNYYVAENLFFPPGQGAGSDPIFGNVTQGSSPTHETQIGQEWVDPTSVAVDGAGNAFVSDFIGGIWKLTLQSNKTYVQSLAVSGGNSVAVDGSGNLYTIEVGSDLYKETLQPDGSYLPTRIATGFVTVTGIAVDEDGNVYVADSGDPFASGGPAGVAVYKETLKKGKYTRSTIDTGWKQPSAIAVDGLGNLYINDSGSVYKETLLQNKRYLKSTLVSKVAQPGGVAVDGAGSVYVTEYSGVGDYGLPGYSVYRLDYSHPSTLSFSAAQRGSTSSDGPKRITVSNAGNEDLNFWDVLYPADFPESRSGARDCTLLTSLEVGENCTITVEFEPRSWMGSMKSTPLSERVVLLSNTMNNFIAEQTVTVSGTEVSSRPTATPRRY